MPFLSVYFSNGIFISAPCASKAATEAASGSQNFRMQLSKSVQQICLQLNPQRRGSCWAGCGRDLRNASNDVDVLPVGQVPDLPARAVDFEGPFFDFRAAVG